MLFLFVLTHTRLFFFPCPSLRKYFSFFPFFVFFVRIGLFLFFPFVVMFVQLGS